ncbi:MAG: dTDP-4-dehydrorhamnose reductase [Bacteroidales bacterium]|nr:dTDP-4-dehydrorhamnose reductase [Bacteroidales bacterium]
MAVILITGGEGQLGNEIKELSGNFHGYEFAFTDKENLDITSESQIREFIATTKPDWLVNCAAYNFVDKAETETDSAFSVNASAVRNLTDAIKGTDCRLIHISTDYVFDGLANTPYNEDCETNPLTVYGKSKLEGEKHALRHHATMIIRTSWLYSTFGNNFVKTIIKHAATRESLRVVFDQTGTPTYAADLAAAILHIISGVVRHKLTFTPGTFHYSNEGVCSWFDFATEIVREAGLKCKITPILTKDYPAPARRPAYSVFDKTRIKENYNIEIPHWRESLARCIKLLKTKQV